ncbi:hypothetical protein A5641_23375 [Mycobacterium sp. 1554424.7]|nr:hypothetical protein A5641_23375 [Mycobacterium sp. 1554424.7]
MVNIITDEQIVDFVHPARLVEHSEFSIYGRAQRPLGTVVSVGARMLQRLSGTHREIRDTTGAPVLLLTTKVAGLKRKTQLDRPGGVHVGEVVQRAGSTLRIGLFAQDSQAGEIVATGRRSWTFEVLDMSAGRVGTITYRPESDHGVVRRYVIRVELDRPVADPLASLIIAAVPDVYRLTTRRDAPT